MQMARSTPRLIRRSNGAVHAIALQQDGKIVVAASSPSQADKAHNYITRLNPDGTPDFLFCPDQWRQTRSFYALAIQPDGKIIVGGGFTTMDAQSYIGLARLNANGSLDAHSMLTTDNLNVYALAIQRTARSSSAAPSPTWAVLGASAIGRLNVDGTLDAAFKSPDGATDTIHALGDPEQRRHFGWRRLTSIGDCLRNYIGRLYPNDGHTDRIFNPDAGAWSMVAPFQADGNILVGGPFTTMNSRQFATILPGWAMTVM